MALTYPTFAQLDPTRLAALLQLFQAVVTEYNPTIDLRRGVVNDLAVYPRALLAATTDQAAAQWLSQTSLSRMVADPATADTDAVDRVVGNFRLARRPAAAATGTIAIILSKLARTTVAAGSRFTINGQVFTANQTFNGRVSSGDVILATDRLISAVAGGNYRFYIDVTAKVAGAAGNARAGAAVTPAQSLYAFVSAYAAADFAGGADAESNASLLSRLAAGFAASAWSNRPSIQAAMINSGLFPTLQSLSITGRGDPEMLRDQHSLWPVAGGGHADLYARSAALYQTPQLSKTATLISRIGAVGTWQFSIAAADAPGYYEIKSISLPSGDASPTSFTVSSEVRSLDLSSAHPDLANAIEGAYTAYQTATVQFTDTTTNASALTLDSSQQAYDVQLRVMPQIAAMQAFWLDPQQAPTAGDVLVRAPTPCFVTLAAALHVPAGTVVSPSGVAASLAAAINALGFAGSLSSSFVATTLHALVPALTSVTGYTAAGRIRAADGSTVSLSGGDLNVPDSPSILVTARTVIFFVEAADITLTVTSP